MQSEEKKTSGIDRRAVLKGAAWAVPAIAVATAAPSASASTGGLKISSGCNPVNGTVAPSFLVTNTDNQPYLGTITIVETINLSTSQATDDQRAAFWTGLGASNGSTTVKDSNVTVSPWVGGTGTNWSKGNGGGNKDTYKTATRTITITGPLAAGAAKGWGQTFASTPQGVSGSTWTAQITSPTGAAVLVPSASMDFNIITGCTPPPTFTETHTFLNFNYEASKWCKNGQGFRPDSIDGTIADGLSFTYKDANGNPLANKSITLNIVNQNSGSFWFVTDPYFGDARGAQLDTITLTTDSNGVLYLDGNGNPRTGPSVSGMPVPGNPAYDNWGYLRYGSGSSNAGLRLEAYPTENPSLKITLPINNGSEGQNPHPGNKTRNYDGGTAC